MSMTTETRQQRLHEVNEHLRYDSTSDSPEIVREKMRRIELMQQREETESAPSEQDNDFWDK